MDHKKIVTKMGFGLFVTTILVYVVQIVMVSLARLFVPDLIESTWFMWSLVGISFYLVGFPTFWAMSKDVPDASVGPLKPLRFQTFVILFFISMAAVYLFNFVGIGINTGIALLKGRAVVNPLEMVVSDSASFANLLFAGILSPVIEEVLFRGILLKKLRTCGDKMAIIASGLAFGLFHGNLSQFFYATALGFLFGYVAVKTNSIRYTIVLHITVNMIGSVIMPILTTTDNTVLIVLSGLMVYVFIIAGIVLLFVNRKKIRLDHLENSEPVAKLKINHIYGNYGVISYSVLCLIMIAFTILY